MLDEHFKMYHDLYYASVDDKFDVQKIEQDPIFNSKNVPGIIQNYIPLNTSDDVDENFNQTIEISNELNKILAEDEKEHHVESNTDINYCVLLYTSNKSQLRNKLHYNALETKPINLIIDLMHKISLIDSRIHFIRFDSLIKNSHSFLYMKETSNNFSVIANIYFNHECYTLNFSLVPDDKKHLSSIEYVKLYLDTQKKMLIDE